MPPHRRKIKPSKARPHAGESFAGSKEAIVSSKPVLQEDATLRSQQKKGKDSSSKLINKVWRLEIVVN
jgi:hypothetical protein